MQSADLARARDLARGMAAGFEQPRFYRVESLALVRSRENLSADPVVARARRLLDEIGENLGHGLDHSLKVTLDAGAIVLVEAARLALSPEATAQCLCLAQVAGLLHDFCRMQANHAERGAERASEILGEWGLSPDSIEVVAGAIRAHEAFQAWTPPEATAARIVAGSLYDADKFRWGVDNFTDMLWLMADSRGIPLWAILDHYEIGIQGIVRIKDTFRTGTGAEYGPEIIDLGLALGKKLFERLRAPSSSTAAPGRPPAPT